MPGVAGRLGIALDGDGDRLVMVDHLGRLVDGDQLLFIIAQRPWHERGELDGSGGRHGDEQPGSGARRCSELGIEFRRAEVGDRYVLAMLQGDGRVLGGETSGHILCLDHTTTGDGLVSALQVLGVMQADRANRWRNWPPA